jgi:hypothetical protein
MKLLTKEIRTKLERNFKARVASANGEDDFHPVVKLFNPVGAATWLLTEIEPNGDIAHGLCDMGMGCPEFGSVSITELENIVTPFGLGIERDRFFTADKPISAYWAEAREKGQINA